MQSKILGLGTGPSQYQNANRVTEASINPVPWNDRTPNTLPGWGVRSRCSLQLP